MAASKRFFCDGREATIHNGTSGHPEHDGLRKKYLRSPRRGDALPGRSEDAAFILFRYVKRGISREIATSTYCGSVLRAQGVLSAVSCSPVCMLFTVSVVSILGTNTAPA
jgi:hypothetical protein